MKRRITQADRLMVAAFVRALWRRLRRILEDQPEPQLCRTCAFRESTDTWKGCETTAHHLAKALQEGTPFYCHANLEKNGRGEYIARPLDQMRLCAGYAAVLHDPRTARVVCEAATDAFNPPKEDHRADVCRKGKEPAAAHREPGPDRPAPRRPAGPG